MEYKEIEISVPWGIIAAKTYGEEKYPPVIAVHGFQDNANSFDCLIPLLPETFYFIIIDLPNHGKSSHFKSKTLPSTFDFVLSIKLIVDYINRKKYIFFGHSYGGQIVTAFSQYYPEYTEKLICFDVFHFWAISAKEFIPSIKTCIERYIKLNHVKIDTAPVYTYDKALSKSIAFTLRPRTEKTGRILIDRSLIKIGDDKYKITTAQNLKYCIRPPISLEYQSELLKTYPIQCPYLIIAASTKLNKNYPEVYKSIIDVLQLNPNFKLEIIEGSHDLHMEDLERVASLVTEFLLKYKNKL